MALILSCIGLYGIISYAVSRRTREFGVRLAVGARQQQVTRMVLRESLRLGMVGMLIGLVFGLMVTSFLESQILFSFQHIGALPYVLVCALLIVTACASGYGPAYRASRTDPVRALREE
jgi:ABC-type antimicrobial peptide transport system permease subunit